MNDTIKTVPVTAMFGQHTDAEGSSRFIALKLDKDGRTISTNSSRLKKVLTLDLGVSRQDVLLMENISGLTVFSINGTCKISLDEPILEKQIPVDKCFSYSVVAEKVYITNTAQQGCSVILVFDGDEEV